MDLLERPCVAAESVVERAQLVELLVPGVKDGWVCFLLDGSTESRYLCFQCVLNVGDFCFVEFMFHFLVLLCV